MEPSKPETLPPTLPHLFTYPSSTPPSLITQGAEALLYKTTYLIPTLTCALKWRPSKPYRHPILDQRLTKARILAEARVLVKCRREGVVVPAVYAVDEGKGCLMVEWIEGEVVRVRLNEWLWGGRGRKGRGKHGEEVGSGGGGSGGWRLEDAWGWMHG
ncbi:b815619f-e127-4066-a952-a8070e7d2c63-CDS [Sclerotinia trifoliorum]|uniref:non-specific serine/threonine protein kinase n=1 Tax=Sclerotinia trifoliorum TaxID=28548 RepID=A0A8H2ZQ66_9HELO|nr:b815619f-e127-4066-a952-a8070e7d2c63-CDS [Sclerotinia trifoliorum]